MTKRKTVAIIPYLKTDDGELSFLVQIRDNNTTHWPNMYWSFGGGLEGIETHQEAAEREFSEEIVLTEVKDGKIFNVRTLPGEITPVTKEDNSFWEVESDVSVKRMYCLDGSSFKHAKDGSFMANEVQDYIDQSSTVNIQVADGEYLVALEGAGSKWLTEEELISGHELLPQVYRDDLLSLAAIIKCKHAVAKTSN